MAPTNVDVFAKAVVEQGSLVGKTVSWTSEWFPDNPGDPGPTLSDFSVTEVKISFPRFWAPDAQLYSGYILIHLFIDGIETGNPLKMTCQPQIPVANFSGYPTSGAAPLTVNFTDSTMNLPTSWEWDFKNIGVIDSTLQNPTYVYNDPGTYSVKLTAGNVTGSITLIMTDYITVTIPAPVANFTGDILSGAAPLTVNFTDTSTNTPTSWAWDFKNLGVTDSILQNPTFVYTTPGTYSVKLTAANAGGSNTLVQTGYVTANPPNLFTWTSRTSTSQAYNTAGSNNSTYILVDSNGRTTNTSTDGVTLTTTLNALPSIGSWITPAWNGSLFATMKVNSNAAATSPDGITWTARTLPGSKIWTSVAYGAGTFCAVSGRYVGGTNMAATSATGASWASQPIDGTIPWSGIAFGNGVFCAIASSLFVGATSNVCATSPTGATWTPGTMPSDSFWTGIAFNGSVFCAVGYGVAATSSNGLSWTPSTIVGSFQAITWTGTYFVAIGTGIAAVSTDGINWTYESGIPNNSWLSIASLNGNVIVGQQVGSGTYMTGTKNP